MPRAAQRRSARPLVLLALTGLLAPCAALSLRAAPMCGAARLCAPRSWAPLAAAQDDGEASPDPVAPAPAPVPVPPSPAGKSDMPTDFLGAPLPWATLPRLRTRLSSPTTLCAHCLSTAAVARPNAWSGPWWRRAGVFDVTTAGGSLGASLVVAAAFGVVLELVKFIDPDPSSPSVFGSAWS
tara:strand:+ start:163 stop:708 length:546 start_codon:yes stop_codon:yes gene_type:complete